jgi:hypothetical protein
MLLDWCQIANDEHLVANCSSQSVAAYRFIQHCRAKKQAMEMTEYGKHGKP